MFANTLTSYSPSYWAYRLQSQILGFNVDPRRNRVDEYERFNEWRRQRYAEEDARYHRRMRILYFAMASLVFALILSL